jgi:hypothetical protein
VARLYAGRDVVLCPDCGEPEPFLGLFLRAGRGAEARLWRLEWISHAPAGFARWVQHFSPRWRRKSEIFVNHCGACGAALADPLGFQAAGGWLCDTGIETAVSSVGKSLAVEGFSPGAVVLPEGQVFWEEAYRITARDFRKRFREACRFTAQDGAGRRWVLWPATAPHRWRLEGDALVHGRRWGAEESFFSFPQARDAARVRWGVPPDRWRPGD